MNSSKYNAFISYSHAIDGKFAPALQRSLQGVAKPWYKRKSLSVFRDKSDLSISPNLWSSIIEGLQDSEHLILLASKKSAESKWVTKEIEFWLKNKSIDTILIIVTDGNLEWGDNDFNWLTTNNISRALKGKFKEEPHYLDFRDIKMESDLSLNNPFYKDKVMSIAATLLQKPLSDLVGEDLKEHKRVKKIRNGVILVLLSLLLFAWYSFNQSVQSKNEAVTALKEAEIQRDTAEFQKRVANSALDEANIQRDSAQFERQNAIEALKEALFQKNVAVQEKENAKNQRNIAETERDIAEANKLSALSNNMKITDPIAAIDLAKQAYKKTKYPTETASQALTSAFYELYESHLLPHTTEIDLQGSKKFDLFDKGKKVIFSQIKDTKGLYIQDVKQGRPYLIRDKVEDFRILEKSKRIIVFQDQMSSQKSDTVRIYDFSGELKKTVKLPFPLESLHAVTNDRHLIFTLSDHSLFSYDCVAEELNFISKVDSKYVLAGKGYSSEKKYISKSKSLLCYNQNENTYFSNLQGQVINSFRFHPKMIIHGFYRDSLLLIEEEGFLKSVNYFSKKISILPDSEILNEELVDIKISASGKFIVAGISSFFFNEAKYERLLIWNQSNEIIVEETLPAANFQNIEISEDEKYLLFQTSNIISLTDGTSPWNNNNTTIYSLGNEVGFNSKLNSYLKDYSSPKSQFLTSDLILHQVAPSKLEVFNFKTNEVKSIINTSSEISGAYFNKENDLLFVTDNSKESIYDLNGNLFLQVPSEQNERIFGIVDENTILYNSGKIWEINKLADPFKLSHQGQLIGHTYYKEENLLLTYSRKKGILWDLESKSVLSSFEFENMPDGIEYVKSKERFILWGGDWIELRDQTGTVLKNRKVHETAYIMTQDIITSDNEDWFYSIHHWEGILVWNISTLDYYTLVKIPNLYNSVKLKDYLIADNILFNSVNFPIDTTIISNKNMNWERVALSSDNEIFIPEDAAVYKIKNKRHTHVFSISPDQKIDQVFVKHQKIFYSGDGFFGCYDMKDKKNIWENKLPNETLRELKYANNHIYITTDNIDFPLRVFSISNGFEISIQSPEVGYIKNLVLSSDDKFLLTYTGYTTLKDLDYNPELMSIDYSLYIRSTKDNTIIAKYDKIKSEIKSAHFISSKEALVVTKYGNIFFVPLAEKIFDLTF